MYLGPHKKQLISYTHNNKKQNGCNFVLLCFFVLSGTWKYFLFSFLTGSSVGIPHVLHMSVQTQASAKSAIPIDS